MDVLHCVCVWLCLSFSAINILPVCSESRPWRAVTAKGEASILLLAVEENHGEEMRGTPLISYTSNLTHWLSSQPWWMCVSVHTCSCDLSLPLVWQCPGLHFPRITALFLKQFEISGHICTVCSAAAHSHSIGRILFNRALGRALTCLALHTLNILFSGAPPLLGRWGRQNSSTYWPG